MTVSEFLARFDLVKPSAGQHLVRCPAHADKTPSLAVKEGNDGQILLRCHAGCETWQILAALGINEKDLFPEKTDSPKRKIVATYDYKDEAGKLLFQAIRYEPKGFSQRQPDPASPGKWIYTLQGVRRVLYRLPDLKGHHSILFVEGEKDADKAWALGVPATTSPMGAGKWDPAYAQQMKQQGVLKVAIIPDNDAVGAAHATAVCAGLQAVGIEVRLCPLPGAPEHGDLSDYLARGNDLAALLALLRTAPVADPITPKAVQAAVVEAKSFKILGEQRYAMEIAREGILLEVSRVRRSSNELIGELAVKVNGHFPHARTFSEGLLSIGDLNFSSVQARGTRAKLLAERSGDKDFDWVGLVEEFTTTVIANERKGTPAVVLADLDEPDEASESWDVLGFPILQELPEVIFGDSSSGKSYFAMYVAGMLAEQGIDVLYADWEFAPSEHRKRLKRLFRPMPRHLHYVRCEHSLRHEVDHLQEIIAKHNVKYMIADSVGFAVEGPAESQEGASAYFRYLRTLRIGTLSIAHIPKQYDDGREAQIFGCYSEDTEVLTAVGWKRHRAVTTNDVVMAFDPATGTIAWEQPTAVHAYAYDGPMIKISTSTTEALITPNHRCVVRTPPVTWKRKTKRRAAGPWKFIEARDLPRELQVPLCGPMREPRPDAPVHGGDDFLRLVGWWIAEGSFHSNNNSFQLAQADGPLGRRMVATLDRLGIEHTLTESHHRPAELPMLYITARKSAAHVTNWLRDHCGSGAAGKRLPPLAWTLSTRQQEVLLQALIDGDGSRLSYGGLSYHTISRQLADDVQRLAIECGRAASTRWDPPGKVWHAPRATVKIGRLDRTTVSLYQRHQTQQQYSGTVYCLTMPSGAYVTRRKGKMAIYGNSVFFKHGGRSIWFIERAKENPRGELRFGLYHRKSNIGELLAPKGFKLLFRGDRTEVEKVDIDSVDELAATLPLIERVRKELIGGPMTLKGLAEAVDSPAPSVRSILSRHKSQFVKAGNKYGLIQRAEDQPAPKPDAEVEF